MAGPGGREIGRVNVRVLPNTSVFGRSLERYLNRIERSLRVEIPVDVDTNGMAGDVQRATSIIEKASKIKVPVETDTRSLDVVSRRVRSSMARIGGAMRAISLPASLISAVPTLLGLGAAAGVASGALLTLPAIGMAGAAAFGALKIGASGFGEALSNIGDPAKFAESLKSLAPAAREAAQAVAGLKPRFDELKTSVQGRLFAGLAEQISNLGNTYLPILDEQFGRIADAANGAGKSVALMLTEASRVADIKSIGAASATAFENLSRAVGPIAAAFVDIGQVGATFLPGLTDGARSAAIAFQQFIANARETGELAGWIRAAGAVFQQLGDIAGNVGSIISGVFTAAGASGAGVLGSLQMATAALAEFVNSAQGSAALSQIFAGLQAAFAGIVPAVMQVVGALAIALGPVIAQLGPAIGQLALSLGGALVSAIQALAPVVQALAGFLAANAQWIGPLAIGFFAVGAAIGPLVGFFTNLATVIKLVGLAFNVLRVAMLANPFLALAAAVIAIAMLIYSNWDAIKSYLVAAWSWIASTATSIWSSINGFFSSTWANITSATSAAWEAVKSTVSNGVSSAVEFVRSLPGRALSALGNLGSLLVSAGRNLVSGFINGIKGMIGSLISTVRNMASSAVSAAKSMLGIASPSKVFAQVGRWTGEGFAEGIEKATPTAVTAAADMADAVVPAVPAAAGSGAAGGTAGAELTRALTDAVLAGLDGARMRIEGDGVARLVNRVNATNARR